MSLSNIGYFPSDTGISLTKFMSNQTETITMETESATSYKPMQEALQNFGGNDFQYVYDPADFI